MVGPGAVHATIAQVDDLAGPVRAQIGSRVMRQRHRRKKVDP